MQGLLHQRVHARPDLAGSREVLRLWIEARAGMDQPHMAGLQLLVFDGKALDLSVQAATVTHTARKLTCNMQTAAGVTMQSMPWPRPLPPSLDRLCTPHECLCDT